MGPERRAPLPSAESEITQPLPQQPPVLSQKAGGIARYGVTFGDGCENQDCIGAKTYLRSLNTCGGEFACGVTSAQGRRVT